MAKTKTLKKRKTLSKNMLQIKKNTGLVAYSPTQNLLDEDLIGNAIWECLKKGDSEGVTEVVVAYLAAKNNSRKIFTKSIARSTMYHTFKMKNPTIKTLARIVSVGCKNL